MTAVFTLLCVCCALPVQPSDPPGVVLLSESPSENLWFHAMEDGAPLDRPGGEKVIATVALGEGSEGSPSPKAETDTVKGAKEEPQNSQNQYGQMVKDLQDMKMTEQQFDNQHRSYRRLKYHTAPVQEGDAVNELVTATQVMMASKSPDKKAELAATTATQDLVEAVKHRQETERNGAKEFATKDFVPVPDTPDEHHNGPFSKLYKLNLQMQKDQSVKDMENSVKPTPLKVLREIYPNKKERRKIRSEEDVFYAHERSKDDIGPKHSKKYHDSFKKANFKNKLMHQLQQAALSYKTRSIAEPGLKYEDVVKGTSLQGITNFYAMSPDDLEHELGSFALQSEALHTQEVDLDKMQEKYIRTYDDGARMVPLDEWKKQWNLEQMVNEQVNDPDNRVTEKMIQEDVAKLKQQWLHPDLEADVQFLLKVKREEEQANDEDIASEVSKAPLEADFKTLEKENILGAKQLAEETKRANERLQNETAHPDQYGSGKRFDSGAEPDYAELDKVQELKESAKLVKKNQKVLLKDAHQLEASGSKDDQVLLDHDLKDAMSGKPTDNEAQQHALISEQAFYKMIQDEFGVKKMEDMKVGIQHNLAKEMKTLVEDGALGGGTGPSYGAQALRSLPTRSNDPQMEGDINLSGNTANAAVPLNKDVTSDDGTSLPQETKDAIRASVKQEAAEKPPREGYAPDASTPSQTGKTPEEVAAEKSAKETSEAEQEAVAVQHPPNSVKMAQTAKNSKTEQAALQQLNTVEATDKRNEEEASDKAATEGLESPEMPKVRPEDDDSETGINTKETAAEINNAGANVTQASMQK